MLNLADVRALPPGLPFSFREDFDKATGYRTESMHGAGSPQAQRIMISRQGNLEQKKKLAREIAGIKD